MEKTTSSVSKGKIYLIPNTLGESALDQVVPSSVKQVIHEIRYFVVENEKNARQLIKLYELKHPQSDLVFFELDKHKANSGLQDFLNYVLIGNDIGVISDAGCPGVADPGAEFVSFAHQKNIDIIPLVGPSSIILALMASGFNGQSFAFNGYLPIDKDQRKHKLHTLERLVYKIDQTQIFIETPYRNNQTLNDFMQLLERDTKLCIACDLTLPTQFIKVKKVKDWKGMLPDLNKRPAIFLIYK